MIASAFILFAGLTGPAHAYRHTYMVWSRDDLPLHWGTSDYTKPDLDADYQIQVLQDSFNTWETQASCAQISDSYDGVYPGNNNGFTLDGRNTIYYDDPAEELGTGVLGLTLCQSDGTVVMTQGGQTYYHAIDCDIAFNAEVGWATDDQIDAGICSNEYSIQSVATHEIGHLWGMGHSCEQNETCDDPNLRYATMYWSTGPCQTFQSDLDQDDIDGITALYGAYATFAATDDSDRYGAVPLQICFEVDGNLDEISSVEWNFGDGTSSTEIAPCHTYDTEGQYTVSLTVYGSGEACGEWSHTQRELAYVVACEPPHPAEGFDGLFTYEHVDGLTYQLINQADTSVYGCIDEIEWDIYDGDSLLQSVKAWSPKVTFPAEGKYRVVLNISGPGVAPGDPPPAEELTIDVTNTPAKGCAAVPGRAVGLLGILAGLGAALLRRRA